MPADESGAPALQTVIEYVQELQVLLKCGPAHAGGKPGVGGGAGASQGFTSVTAAGSGPFGVATPGGGFEVLPQPQQPGAPPATQPRRPPLPDATLLMCTAGNARPWKHLVQPFCCLLTS